MIISLYRCWYTYEMLNCAKKISCWYWANFCGTSVNLVMSVESESPNNFRPFRKKIINEFEIWLYEAKNQIWHSGRHHQRHQGRQFLHTWEMSESQRCPNSSVHEHQISSMDLSISWRISYTYIRPFWSYPKIKWCTRVVRIPSARKSSKHTRTYICAGHNFEDIVKNSVVNALVSFRSIERLLLIRRRATRVVLI